MQQAVCILIALSVTTACQTGRSSAGGSPAPVSPAMDSVRGELTPRPSGGVAQSFQTITVRQSADTPPIDVPPSSDSAIREWRPFRAVLSATPARCVSVPSRATARNRVASFGTTPASRGSVSLFLDSTGQVQRYTEHRGGFSIPGTTGVRTDAERDSLLEDARLRTRFTRIALNYATGKASATNYGGDLPVDAIGGTVADFEGQPFMNDVKAKTAAVRAICDN